METEQLKRRIISLTEELKALRTAHHSEIQRIRQDHEALQTTQNAKITQLDEEKQRLVRTNKELADENGHVTVANTILERENTRLTKAEAANFEARSVIVDLFAYVSHGTVPKSGSKAEQLISFLCASCNKS